MNPRTTHAMLVEEVPSLEKGAARNLNRTSANRFLEAEADGEAARADNQEGP